MSNSKRQTLLDYLYITLFPTITTASSYNFTVATNERGIRPYDAMNESEFPALFVASADEERKNASNKSFISVITVHIFGAVQSASGKIQVELDKLIEDVTKALYADPTQGNRVAWTDIRAIMTDEGDQQPFAFFRMAVEFEYIASGTAP